MASFYLTSLPSGETISITRLAVPSVRYTSTNLLAQYRQSCKERGILPVRTTCTQLMFCDFRTLEKASSGFFLVPDDLEFEFVESTTSTVINGDASLMWLLRPTANQLSVNISIAANEGDAPLRVFYTVGAPVDLLGYRYIVDPKSDLGERLIADGYTLVFSTKKDEPGVHMVTVFEDDSTTMAIMQLISEPIAVEKQLTYRTALSMLQGNVRELVIAHSPDGQFSNFIFGHDVSRYLPK